jgi:lipopolysaccharide biosynthesis protein
LELAAQGREWGEERVYYRDENGRMRFVPARWTNIAASDAFVLTAAGRAWFRLEDLIRLDNAIKNWKG